MRSHEDGTAQRNPRAQRSAPPALGFRVVECRPCRAPIRSQDARQTASLEVARYLRQLASSQRKNLSRQRQRRAARHSFGQSWHGRKRDDQPHDPSFVSVDPTGRSRAGASAHHVGISFHPPRTRRLHQRRWAKDGHGRRRSHPHAARLLARTRPRRRREYGLDRRPGCPVRSSAESDFFRPVQRPLARERRYRSGHVLWHDPAGREHGCRIAAPAALPLA